MRRQRGGVAVTPIRTFAMYPRGLAHRLRAAALLLLVAAAPALAAETLLHHVHGLAFSADGSQLLVPSHHGLAVYRDGRWSKAPGPPHDYMGFAVTRKALYSSGHPAPGTGLVNPFGLIRSRDGGAWDKLGLEGEADFHLLAGGYESGAIYVYNPAPNSRMEREGIYYTLDQGFRWRRAAAEGLTGRITAIAVHPSDAKRVAVATDRGAYLSKDTGANFEPVVTGEQTLSVFFDLDGEHLWVGGYRDGATLKRIALKSGKAADRPLPPLTRDAVAYIAQNPKQRSQYAIATFERDVYLSEDAGRSWKAIARRGMAS